MKRHSINGFRPAAWVFATLCGVLVSASELRKQSEITIEDIKRAWTERQEKIKTARFTWKEQRGVRVFGDSRDPAQQSKGILPLQQSEIPEVTLVFGSRPGQVRFETEDAGSRVDGAPPKPSLGAFNGLEGTRYYRHSGMEYGMGSVHKTWDDRELYYLAPLELVCRPMDEHLRAVDFDLLSLRPGDVLVDGRKCLLLSEVGQRHPKLSTEIYVDVEREFIPLRYVSRLEGNLSVQSDIAYTMDADGLWLPESWEAAFFFPDGNILNSTRNTVVLREINRPISADQFRIDFPPLTKVVHKTIDPAKDEQLEAYSLVMPDGTRRPISGLGDDPLQPLLGARPPGWYRGWLFVINALIAAALIGYWVLRRGHSKG